MSGGTIYYTISKGTVYILLLIDNGSTYTIATEAFYTPKSPYKLLLESAFKKHRQLYIRPNKGTGGCII